MIRPSTAVATPALLSLSNVLHTERGGFVDLELLRMAFSGLLALRYLQGSLQREVWLGEQVLLSRLAPQSTDQPVPKCLVQILPEIAMCSESPQFSLIASHTFTDSLFSAIESKPFSDNNSLWQSASLGQLPVQLESFHSALLETTSCAGEYSSSPQ